MKIVSTSKSKEQGVIEFSKFELSIVKKALANFKIRVNEDQYESVVGGTSAELKILKSVLSEFMDYTAEPLGRITRQAVSMIRILELNQQQKSIILELSHADARAFYSSLTKLWMDIDEHDCQTITGLYLHEVEEVARKLNEIYAQIPWEI